MRNSAGMNKIHENIRTIHLEHYPCCMCVYIYILYTHTATYGNYVYHMFLQSVDTTIHWIKWSWMNGSFCKEVRRWLRIINDFKHVLTDNGFLFESFGIRLEHRLRHLTLRFFFVFLRGKLRCAVDTPCAGLQCLVDVGATQLDGILEGVSEHFCLWSRTT